MPPARRTTSAATPAPTAPIPVIDLFAGPGGLGEGFAIHRGPHGQPAYRIALSIEKDHAAHQTLELRAFFHQFRRPPEAYYDHLRGPADLPRASLFATHPHEAARARDEAWNAELGTIPASELDRRIRAAIGDTPRWVLVGGPPCQAYSIVGRARRGGISAGDPRVRLYREYLGILARHAPPVFVMENVKGLLSSRVDGESVFDAMLADFEDPARAIGQGNSGVGYHIHSLVSKPRTLFAGPDTDPRRYIVACEDYGVPQARHRVILIGTRSDLHVDALQTLRKGARLPAASVLDGLPRLRSGLSKGEDSPEAWREVVRLAPSTRWFEELRRLHAFDIAERVERVSKTLALPRADRGGEFVSSESSFGDPCGTLNDQRLLGVCNHSSRSHIADDIHRYLFAACFSRERGSSPTLRDYPQSLLPNHENVKKAVRQGHFSDRFRVQVGRRPATTITAHIAKDGHYFIHDDPSQCRSLTVREAARIQTFPDNYLFCGPRTEQYKQVGNAVPPEIARRIAGVVETVLSMEVLQWKRA